MSFNRYIYLILALFVFTGCEKVIEIDLNEADPRFVIEGLVREGLGNNSIRITKSGSYFEPNEFVEIAGAVVTISDDMGNNYTLTQDSTTGLYTDPGLAGVPGRQYALEIQIEGETITAVSTMPANVPIDSIIVQSETGGFGGQTFYLVRSHYSDPAAIKNYYKFDIFVNGFKDDGFNVRDDNLNDGQSTFFTYFQGDFEPGDMVVIQMYCIDAENYEYFEALAEQRGFGGTSASPGNPESNLSGDALGYFGAYAVGSDTVVIE